MASKGSQHWLRTVVTAAPERINRPIREALGLPDGATIDWKSPVATDDFKELRDQMALDRLEVTLEHRKLSDFWPARGPVWDGLARTSTGEVILVEAKAHIPELVSGGTKASPASLGKITTALKEVHADIASGSSKDLTGPYYQYANRLAFLHLLRRQNNVNAHLVHVLFLNAKEMQGPSDPAEWRGALTLLRASLGLQNHRLKPFTHDVFIDIEDLEREGFVEPLVAPVLPA